MRRRAPWQNYVLGLACIGAIIAAYELVGPPSSTPSTEIRTTTAQLGVVQTTVSASGNLAPASEADLNFKSSGILTGLYVQAGQHVTQGQLLAAIDPTSASVALQEAEANLQAAQAKLAETEANPSAGSGSGVTNASAAAFTGPSGASGATASTGTTGTTGSSAATGATSPATQHKTTTTKKKASSAESAVTQATDAANIASAEASVVEREADGQERRERLGGTKLYAPSSGTIASISGAVGDAVTAGSGTRRSSASGGLRVGLLG